MDNVQVDPENALIFEITRRAGPRSLDSNWNRISVFLHDRRSLLERRHEEKAT